MTDPPQGIRSDMRSLLLVAASILSALGWSTALTQQSGELIPPTSIVGAAARLADTALRCPERLWPDVRWKDLAILFSLRGNSTGVLLRSDDSARWTLSAVDLTRDEYRAASVSGRRQYAFFDYQGKRAVAVTLNDDSVNSITRAIELALHEGFHQIGQERFVGAHVAERGRNIPADSMLAYMRRMLIRALKTSYESGDKLGRASFWHQRSSRQVSQVRKGAMRAIDRTEGSAEYVGALAVALFERGCDADDSQLHAAVLRWFDNNWVARYQPLIDQLPEIESYATGVLAGVLLDIAGNISWRRRVEVEQTPVEALLSLVESVADEEDLALQESIRQSQAHQDSQLLPRMRNLLSHVNASEQYVVAISREKRTLSYTTNTGLLFYDDGSHRSRLILGVKALFGGDDARIELLGQDILLADDTPCGGRGRWVFPVAQSGVVESERGLSIRTDRIAMNLRDKSKVIRPDARWLCVN